MPSLRVAAAQLDVAFGDARANLAAVLAALEQAAVQGAKLVVFPECALTGYCFTSLEEAREAALTLDGPVVSALVDACRRLGVLAVTGLVERDGDRIHNTAVLTGPDGLVGRYRKCHLPVLGVDRFATAGDPPLEPFDTPFARLGVGICYDGSFPELSRVLKLRGAQILLLPTNWPEKAQVSAEFQPIVRAHENHVHFVAVNRVGTERGFTFIGQSKIIDCTGRVLARAGSDRPEVLVADLDPAAADCNRVVYSAGEYEIDRVGHRRPELYGPLTR
ncbi:MAG: carbon-nitrogen hydrolase family protein [Candidatus Wallbacteria bacterium]|nr:carbon-nitrogen hydrolase family protein [Candidatus Wallbacteria bacterium]MBI4868706.1 carbon-nitrogen hydrolase family protein [Candidatus Wallbacteria bacterium]